MEVNTSKETLNVNKVVSEKKGNNKYSGRYDCS